MMLRRTRSASGVTLIELMVAVALVAVLLGLAAPSFQSFFQMQRLRGTNAQLVTDLQFARSEAVSRSVEVQVRFQTTTTMTCYILFTTTSAAQCDCTLAVGARCPTNGTNEIRTVQVPTDSAVVVSAAGNTEDNFTFDPRTGGMKMLRFDLNLLVPPPYNVHVYLDSARKLRDVVAPAGVVKVCAPSGSSMGGPAC